MIEIEFEEPIIERCECCGEETVRLTRFVYQDDDAFAVYYAKFTRGHNKKVVYGLSGLGEWGEGGEPADRLAFPFRIWSSGEYYQVGLVDQEQSPWSDVTYLGRILDREEALTHPWVKDVFHITDHMVVDDKSIIEYFEQEQQLEINSY
jgi:hypothetical protein